MADTWGDYVDLNVTAFAIEPGKSNLNERELLPNPLDTSNAPSSVLTGVGRLRDRWNLGGYVTKADYLILKEDYQKQIYRTAKFDDGTIVSVRIEKFQARREIGTNYYFYDVTFVES
jgi:hypothetical protein